VILDVGRVMTIELKRGLEIKRGGIQKSVPRKELAAAIVARAEAAGGEKEGKACGWAKMINSGTS